MVASGKGGTGKSFFSSNLAYYINVEYGGVVAVDADAEAPDLLLLLGGSCKCVGVERLGGSWRALIDYSRCTSCLECVSVCRFYALDVVDGKLVVNKLYCEGCRACSLVCRYNAIDFIEVESGVIRHDISCSNVYVVTTDLVIGGRNTGKLVYLAREQASKKASEKGYKYIVVDAAAGIGCPVISSIVNSDLLVIVVEPTKPSINGALRLKDIADHFSIDSYLVVNKTGFTSISPEDIARELGIELLGSIPYDRVVVDSIACMKPMLAYKPDHVVSKKLREVFTRVMEVL